MLISEFRAIDYIPAYKKETIVVRAIESKSNLTYVGWKNPMIRSCSVGGTNVQIQLIYRQPQDRGECGAEESASLKVSIDGLVAIDEASFHTERNPY